MSRSFAFDQKWFAEPQQLADQDLSQFVERLRLNLPKMPKGQRVGACRSGGGQGRAEPTGQGSPPAPAGRSRPGKIDAIAQEAFEELGREDLRGAEALALAQDQLQ